MTAKKILGLVPGLQATALIGKNLKLLKKPTPKKMLKTGIVNLVGIGLIGATAKEINKLP